MANFKVNTSYISKSMEKLFVGSVEEVTDRLARYADSRLKKSYARHNFIDDTYSLKDSYCWGVWYNGRLMRSGFLSDTPEAIEDAMYHGNEVDGRESAKDFLNGYKSRQPKGWEWCIGAFAPYAPILEKSAVTQKKYVVTSGIFDDVIRDIGSARVIEFNYKHKLSKY